jgi:predicted nucleic acid-binding protein
MKPVILDTGPLVAWFCPKDQYHAWARRMFSQLSPGSVLSEAVLTEVCHLVSREGVSRSEVIKSLMQGRVKAVCLNNELISVANLLDRYADAPMDFADACVVRLAELHPALDVCTVDAHFRFFRKNDRDPISLIAPFAPTV